MWPLVDVVVPVHDEASLIAGKIENLRQLDYPSERILFWIVDGASADATGEIARAAIGGDPRFVLLEGKVADKTAQLNLVLPQCRSNWVLVTDADARLSPDTLSRLVREGESDPRIGAVGSTVRPLRAHPWEELHWRIADQVRLRESACGSASIVTAPCYLMRRGIVTRLPDDVVADDVHVAFRTSAAGFRTAFVAADVTELRSPISLLEMLRHKHRKANAYLREVRRFLSQTGPMPPLSTTLLRHAAQTFGALLIVTRPGVRSRIGLAATLAVALLGAAVTLPFFRQHACFPKVDRRRARVPAL
jgi:cellulose synthase/poly-beta-1,6-N-acetylglucosamine synthase-like glycosyltransferase